MPQLKAQLAKEEVDGTPLFVEGRDFFAIDGIGLVGLSVTTPPARPIAPARRAEYSTYTIADELIDLQGKLKLCCAWRTTMELISGGDSISYRVTKEVRKSAAGDTCVTKVTHPAPHGELLKTDYVKGWIKAYWAHEELQGEDEPVGQHKARIEALKAERTPGKGGKTCISALLQPTCVIEFLRLEAKHCAATAPEDWHPQLTVGGETLPRDTLAFPTRASFTGEDWPEQFARPVQATRQADDEDDDEEELTEYEQIQRRIVNARLSLHAASAGGESQPRERRAGAGTKSQRPS